jgi:ABC-2 type transport system ATP-binding protein
MSIVVKEVTKQYGSQWALDHVSFEIPKGQIVGFLGPNGAGKSTMMKIITSFIPPSSGSIEVNGLDISDNSMETRRVIGYLPEHNPLYLEMYVREYLSFIAGIYQLSNVRSKVEAMIERVGLGIEAHKKIGTLSKGYRQRIGLAQALIHDPQVLILDEPTSGLDPNQLIEIRSLIKEVGREKTVMFSTHIMQEVEALCQRTIIINRGKLVQDGETQSLKQLGGQTILQLELDQIVNEKVLSQLPFVLKVNRITDFQWEVVAKGDEDIRIKMADWAASSPYRILTMNVKEQRLEDVFKDLTSAQS